MYNCFLQIVFNVPDRGTDVIYITYVSSLKLLDVGSIIFVSELIWNVMPEKINNLRPFRPVTFWLSSEENLN